MAPPKKATPNPTITLGNRYRDSVTGFTGVATVYSVHLNGCYQVVIEAKANADGKAPLMAFDEQRLEALPDEGEEAAEVPAVEVTPGATGGPGFEYPESRS